MKFDLHAAVFLDVAVCVTKIFWALNHCLELRSFQVEKVCRDLLKLCGAHSCPTKLQLAVPSVQMEVKTVFLEWLKCWEGSSSNVGDGTVMSDGKNTCWTMSWRPTVYEQEIHLLGLVLFKCCDLQIQKTMGNNLLYERNKKLILSC